MQHSQRNTAQQSHPSNSAYLVFRLVTGSFLLVLVAGVVVDLQSHQAFRGVSVALPLRSDDIVSLVLSMLARQFSLAHGDTSYSPKTGFSPRFDPLKRSWRHSNGVNEGDGGVEHRRKGSCEARVLACWRTAFSRRGNIPKTRSVKSVRQVSHAARGLEAAKE